MMKLQVASGVASMLSEPCLQSSNLLPGALDFARVEPMCITVTTRRPLDSQPQRRQPARPGPDVSRLSEGQRDCLRLVHQLMTSKDIARQLGVSNHTVDMRIRTALKTLDVTSRAEAARLVAAYDEAQGQTYQPLVYQPSEIVDDSLAADEGAPASLDGAAPQTAFTAAAGQAPLASPVVDPAATATASARHSAPWTSAKDWPDTSASDPGISVRPFPHSRPYGPVNNLSIGARLSWVLVIAFGSAMGFGAVLAALAALKSLL